MPGDETKNFDLVIEIAEQAYRDILGALFDSNGIICSILGDLESSIPGFPHIPCGAFSIEVLFDVPTDISLPPGTADTVDVRMTIGEGGSAGSLRFVAGVDVDSTTAAGIDLDVVRVNLAGKTYYAKADITGVPDTGGIVSGFFASALRGLGELLIFPVPVNRSSTSPTDLHSADVRIIDDTSPDDRDALAVLLTFGGGMPGDRAGFTRSFIPTGETGGIAVDFDWLCRIIRPRLASALGIPESDFDAPCRLNTTVRIDEDNEVDLTRLELTLVDGAIQVTAAVRKSGTGYSATGTVSGRIRVAVQAGNLVIQSQVDNPDIDIDLDWWVWLAAAVIGAIIGGVISGVIGAIVGAILAPLITWLATEIIEGLIQDITSKVVDAVGSLNFQVPAVGLNLVFQEVFIDDVVVGCDVKATDTAPIRASGVMVVRNGQRFNLDNGLVGDETLAGADMVWEGLGNARRLRTLCAVKLARTGTSAFDGFTRYRMYGLPYAKPATVPITELAIILPGFLGGFGIATYLETNLVYGVRTDEDRYSLIQAIEVKDDQVRIAYQTYEKVLPSIEIRGGFRYEGGLAGATGGIVREGDLASARRVVTDDSRVPCQPAQATPAPARGGTVQPSPDPCIAMKAGPSRLPGYTLPGMFPVLQGRFQARTMAVTQPVKRKWSINGKPLDQNEGSVTADGLKLAYSIDGDTITMTPKAGSGGSFELGATAKDAEGITLATSRCVELAGSKSAPVRGTPSWTVFRDEYRGTFGSLEVASAGETIG
ncbi:MAG: hypothetical protein LUQ60_01485 [Methanomicrobiales archaeon]|nr:hypothetical protein [Methanomicrobiales archaeon]